MKNRILKTLLISLFCLNTITIFATTYTYETVSGVTGWRGGVAPPNPLPTGDDVVIDANYVWYAVLVSNGTVTVNAGKRLNIGQFTNNGTVVNNGTLVMNGIFTNGTTGIITNNGAISVAYISTGESARLSNFGSLNINLGSTLVIANPGLALPATVQNETGGITNIYGTVYNYLFWYNQAGSILNVYGTIASPNATNGSVFNAGTINIHSGGVFSYHCIFDNTGTFNLISPDLATRSGNVLGTLNIVSGGTMESNRNNFFDIGGNVNWASGGIINIARQATITTGKTLLVPTGAILNIISGGALNINAGASFTNQGTFSGGLLTNNGSVTNSATFNSFGFINNGIFNNSGTLSNGSFDNKSSATFTNTGTFNSLYSNNDGTLNNTGIINLNNSGGTFTLNTNPVSFPSGTFNWAAGQVIIGTNGVFPLTTNLTIQSNQTFTINGIMTISNSSTVTNNGAISVNGTLNNEGNIDSRSSFFLNVAGVVNNNGTIINDYFQHRYYGTMNNSGIIRNNPGRSITIETTGNLNNNPTGTIFNNANITNANNFTNNGTLKSNPAVTGSFTTNPIMFGATSTIEPGTLLGRLSFPNDVNLSTASINLLITNLDASSSLARIFGGSNFNISNATLNVIWDAYTPVGVRTFKIVNATSRTGTGQFLNVNIAPITGLAFIVTYTPTEINISTTVVLPVELRSFSAKANGFRAELNWQTASETNVKNFDIEKSLDGEKYDKIKEIKANNTPSVYQAFDDTPLQGLGVYYRLKINDLDGKSDYSKTVYLEKNSDKSIKISRNTEGSVLVETNDKIELITVTNTIGQTVKSTKDKQFLIHDLNAGIYIVSVKTDKGYLNQKFFKD